MRERVIVVYLSLFIHSWSLLFLIVTVVVVASFFWVWDSGLNILICNSLQALTFLQLILKASFRVKMVDCLQRLNKNLYLFKWVVFDIVFMKSQNCPQIFTLFTHLNNVFIVHKNLINLSVVVRAVVVLFLLLLMSCGTLK